MLKKTLSVNFCLLVMCAACFGQTLFQGLTPGKSTRAEVERALGRPVKSVSKTLIEYKSPEEAGRLFMQYRDESAAAVVERIELTCFTGRGDSRPVYDRCVSALNLERLQGVLADAESRIPKEQGWEIVRHFGSPRFMVWTQIGKGIEAEVRVAFYSKKLYESAAPGGGCTGTIFGTWQTERGRMTVVREGDDRIRGTYAKNNGSFSLKQVRGGYMGAWKEDTGSGTMALMLDNNTFTASLSRGATPAAQPEQPRARSGVGAELDAMIDSLRKQGGGAAVGEIVEGPSEPQLSLTSGLPPGEPLKGKCVP